MAKKPARGRGKATQKPDTEIIPAPQTAPELADPPKVEDAEVVEEKAADAPETIILPDDTETAGIDDNVDAATDDAPKSPSDEPAAAMDAEPAVTDDTPDAKDSGSDRPDPAPQSAPSSEPARGGGGFLPLLLGGVLAGAIGYAIAWFQTDRTGVDPEVAEVLNEYSDSILALEERVTEIPAEFNAAPLAEAVSALEDQMTALREGMSAEATTMSGALADFEERLDRVERQPSEDGTLPETAVAALQDDMQELRDQIAAQQDALQTMVDDATAQLDATRAEAEAIEAQAVQSAQAATRRAALSRIQAALESGAPFAPAMTDLEAAMDEDVPDPLVQAADEGVATMSTLQAEFPDAARDALAAARSEGVSGEETGGLGSFLRTQFDVRSVAPQEGSSVDAILSRAEDALRQGRLNDALAEIAALPEPVRATMTDWVARAEARAAAIDAATTLSMQNEG